MIFVLFEVSSFFRDLDPLTDTKYIDVGRRFKYMEKKHKGTSHYLFLHYLNKK